MRVTEIFQRQRRIVAFAPRPALYAQLDRGDAAFEKITLVDITSLDFTSAFESGGRLSEHLVRRIALAADQIEAELFRESFPVYRQIISPHPVIWSCIRQACP